MRQLSLHFSRSSTMPKMSIAASCGQVGVNATWWSTYMNIIWLILKIRFCNLVDTQCEKWKSEPMCWALKNGKHHDQNILYLIPSSLGHLRRYIRTPNWNARQLRVETHPSIGPYHTRFQIWLWVSRTYTLIYDIHPLLFYEARRTQGAINRFTNLNQAFLYTANIFVWYGFSIRLVDSTPSELGISGLVIFSA